MRLALDGSYAFPACNPVTLLRQHVPRLARDRYLVALKSDGVRYLLYLTTRLAAPRAPSRAPSRS